MIYLAAPFTKYPMGAEAAFIHASRIAGRLLARGKNVFCPVAHSFAVGVYGKLDLYDGAFWNLINAPYLDFCSVMYVAKLDGWRASEGIAHEIDTYLGKKPIWLLDPETLDLEVYLPEKVKA